MKDQIKWVLNTMPKSDDRQLPIMSLSNVAKARFFHSTFPQYSVTPLDRLDGMAQYLGLAGLCVKNESFRFGLNAFKVLGGSFAMAKYIAKEMGRDVSEMTYDYLTSEAFRKEFGQATFFTATDGNHGRGVAWAANKLGQKAVVHMPKGSSKPRYDNIAKEGAAVTIEEVNYDDCVRMAAAEAAQTEHGVIVQDTAWEGYEEIPSWIMQGYGTMANEAAEQLRQVDEQFHDLICYLSKRTVIMDTLIPLHRKTRRYRRISMEDWSRTVNTRKEHKAIFDAMASGDADLAESLMAKHIENAKKHMLGGFINHG